MYTSYTIKSPYFQRDLSQVPPVGINSHFAHFLEKTGMEDEICNAISKVTAPNWETVATSLAVQEPFKLRFMKCDILVIKQFNIQSNHSKIFIAEFIKCAEATVRAFVTAMHDAHPGFDPLCKKICEQVGDLGFYNELDKDRLPAAVEHHDDHFVAQMLAAQETLRKEKEELQRKLAEVQLKSVQEAKQMPSQEDVLKENEKLKRNYAQLEQKFVRESEKTECSICTDKTVTKSAQCGHLYCDVCIQKIHNCAICRLKIDNIRTVYLN